MSSAHVYCRLQKYQSIESMSEELLEDCAQLVKANSIQGAQHAMPASGAFTTALFFATVRILDFKCSQGWPPAHIRTFCDGTIAHSCGHWVLFKVLAYFARHQCFETLKKGGALTRFADQFAKAEVVRSS